MEKNYSMLIVFFVLVTMVSLTGFYTSYLSIFPNYHDFSNVIHIHFVAFLCWLSLTIVQPVLIKSGKLSLHRKLGKASYFIALVMVTTMAILVVEKTKRMLATSTEEASVTGIIGLLDIVSFSAYFIVAMVNRRNVRWHVAFIISATLIVLNPGMARLLNQMKPGLGLIGSVIIPFLVPLCIILYEKIKLKNKILKSPYSLFFLCWTLEIAVLIIVPQTDFWKSLILSLK